MTLLSSQGKTELDSIENLFTLGHFEDAYKLGEMVITRLFTQNSLPPSLLHPRVAAANVSKNSNVNTNDLSLTDRNGSFASNRMAQSLNSGSVATHSTSSSRSRHSTSSTSSSRTRPNLKLDDSEFLDTDEELKALASSSEPFTSNRLKDACYDELSSADQQRVRQLLKEYVAYIAIMVQCLFELHEQQKIKPFLHHLCGSKYDTYPFELAYLLINLNVTNKEYDLAMQACETVISSLRSQLGPMPFMKAVAVNSISTSQVQSPQVPEGTVHRNSASSSSSSDQSAASAPANELEEENGIEEEGEHIVVMRQNYQSLLQLYIFHVLCETHRFTEAKNFLFPEARIHANVIQEWLRVIEELEEQYSEEMQRAEEQKQLAAINASKSAPQHNAISTSQELVSSPSPSSSGSSSSSTRTYRNAGGHDDTQDTPTSNWWSSLFGIGSNQGEESNTTAKDRSSSGEGNDGRSLQVQVVPLHRRLLRHFVEVYKYLASTYASMSAGEQLILFILAATSMIALLYSILSSKRNNLTLNWLYKRFEFLPKLLGISSTPSSAPATTVLATRASSAQVFRPSSTNARAVIGSSNVTQPRFR